MSDHDSTKRPGASSLSRAGRQRHEAHGYGPNPDRDHKRVDHQSGERKHDDRYAAVIAALIDVRPDEATARFDDELADALSHHRIDAETARALRWWQRTSVHAAESYAATVVPGVFAMRDQADARARAEAANAAATWRAAIEPGVRAVPPSACAPDGASRAALRLIAPIAELAATQLVPELFPELGARARRASAERTRRAVQAAFAAVSDSTAGVAGRATAPPNAGPAKPAAANGSVGAATTADGDLRSHPSTIDLTATTVTHRESASDGRARASDERTRRSDQRKEPPDHADPAPSA